jgi:hypothetical protein
MVRCRSPENLSFRMVDSSTGIRPMARPLRRKRTDCSERLSLLAIALTGSCWRGIAFGSKKRHPSFSLASRLSGGESGQRRTVAVVLFSTRRMYSRLTVCNSETTAAKSRSGTHLAETRSRADNSRIRSSRRRLGSMTGRVASLLCHRCKAGSIQCGW